MARRGGSFGILVLVVTLAIVLLLVARQWKSIAPTATQLSGPDSSGVIDDHGQSGAGEEVRSGTMPDLNEMQQETNEHAEQVQEALAATQ
jgi:hypothetical protein